MRETFIQAMSMAKSGLADMNNEHVRTDWRANTEKERDRESQRGRKKCMSEKNH